MPKLLKLDPPQTVPSQSRELSALASRVEQVRSECERYIDDRAAELKRELPALPISVLRMEIVAGFRNCPCASFSIYTPKKQLNVFYHNQKD